MWREHNLKRSDYSSDLNGLLRFLYAQHFMSTAFPESCCLALLLCEELVDEDLLVKQRLASGLISIGVSFSCIRSGDLLGRSSRASAPSTFTPGAKVTFARTTLDECHKDSLTIKEVVDSGVIFDTMKQLPDDLFEACWRDFSIIFYNSS